MTVRHERQLLGILNRNIWHLMRNRFAVQHTHYNAAEQILEENDNAVVQEERGGKGETLPIYHPV